MFQNSKGTKGFIEKSVALCIPATQLLSWGKPVLPVPGLSFQRYFMLMQKYANTLFHLFLCRWEPNIQMILCLAFQHASLRVSPGEHPCLSPSFLDSRVWDPIVDIVGPLLLSI